MSGRASYPMSGKSQDIALSTFLNLITPDERVVWKNTLFVHVLRIGAFIRA